MTKQEKSTFWSNLWIGFSAVLTLSVFGVASKNSSSSFFRGSGRIGDNLASSLKGLGTDLVMISRDAAKVAKIRKQK